MNKIILVLIIIIVLLILGGAYFMSQPTNKQTTTQQPAQQPTNLNANVSIKSFAFNPTPLTIKAGTTVTWTNNDPMPHQIKSSEFNSSVLSAGDTFSFTFSDVGQYDYSCAIHPSMKGQIIITQ